MFGKLKDLVWQDDPKAAPAQPASAPQPAAVQAPIQMNPGYSMPSDAPVNSVLDVAAIQAAITSNIEQEPGFANYAKFAAAAGALEKVIIAEATRMQAAQATTSLTRDQLLESLSSYQGVLTNETANFQNTYVAGNEQNILALNEQITAKNTEMQELTARLAQVSSEKEELIRQSTTASAELAKAKIDFDSVVKTITARFTDIATKLQQYLSA